MEQVSGQKSVSGEVMMFKSIGRGFHLLGRGIALVWWFIMLLIFHFVMAMGAAFIASTSKDGLLVWALGMLLFVLFMPFVMARCNLHLRGLPDSQAGNKEIRDIYWIWYAYAAFLVTIIICHLLLTAPPDQDGAWGYIALADSAIIGITAFIVNIYVTRRRNRMKEEAARTRVAMAEAEQQMRATKNRDLEVKKEPPKPAEQPRKPSWGEKLSDEVRLRTTKPAFEKRVFEDEKPAAAKPKPRKKPPAPKAKPSSRDPRRDKLEAIANDPRTTIEERIAALEKLKKGK